MTFTLWCCVWHCTCIGTRSIAVVCNIYETVCDTCYCLSTGIANPSLKLSVTFVWLSPKLFAWDMQWTLHEAVTHLYCSLWYYLYHCLGCCDVVLYVFWDAVCDGVGLLFPALALSSIAAVCDVECRMFCTTFSITHLILCMRDDETTVTPDNDIRL